MPGKNVTGAQRQKQIEEAQIQKLMKTEKTRRPNKKGSNSAGWKGVAPQLHSAHLGIVSRAFLKQLMKQGHTPRQRADFLRRYHAAHQN